MDNGQYVASAANSRQELHVEQIEFQEKKRPLREKCLIILSVFLFLVVVVFLALFLVYFFKDDSDDDQDSSIVKTKQDVCESPGCLQVAGAIAGNLNTSVDPCDDFYAFACGHYDNNHPLTLTRKRLNPMITVHYDVQDDLRDLLETPNPNAIEATQKAQTFYRACLNAATFGAAANTSLMALLNERGPNVFPSLERDWVDEGWTWSQILSKVPPHLAEVEGLHFVISAIIPMFVTADIKQSDKNMIYFTQPPLPYGVRPIFLANRFNRFLQLYEMLYRNIATNLGADPDTAKEDAKDVVDFEIQLANATAPIEMRQDQKALYKTMTIRQLTQRYPDFNWLEFLRDKFSPLGIDVTQDEEVAIDALDYYDKIFPVINATSTRTLLNFAWWKFLFGFADFLTENIQVAMSAFEQVFVTGSPRETERWTTCVTFTNTLFPDALGRLFVEEYFSAEKRAKVEDMIGDLKDAFRDIVRESDWMTSQTKQAAQAKIDTMINKIGYQDSQMNDTFLNELMKDVVMRENEPFENILNISNNLYMTILNRLRKPVNKDRFPLSTATVNAFYNFQTNAIIFPAAILQNPVYNDKNPDVLTYGGLGFFIGHEITHGFDNKGALFDKDANLADWWHPEDVADFTERSQCLVQQYSNFSFPQIGMSVNGHLTLGENIADNGALKEAYKAYKKMVAKKKKEDPVLPALDYTSDQLFFIGAAQLWCQNIDPNYLPGLLRGVHSPNRFRVIGPMQNSMDFAKAFNCPEGSYMNPAKKCHVW